MPTPVERERENPTTVEQAMMLLAETNAPAPADAHLIRTLAERSEADALTSRQRQLSYSILRRYRSVLAATGIRFEEIPDPSTGVSPPPPASRVQEVISRQRVAVTVDGGRIHVRAPFRLKDVCKSIPAARWNKNKRAWTYPASPTSATAVREAFMGNPTTVDDEFRRLADEEMKRRQAARSADVEDDKLPDLDWSRVLRTDPWPHQQRATLWAAGRLGIDAPARLNPNLDSDLRLSPEAGGGVMLALEMGVGKSLCVVALTALARATRVIIHSPLSVLRVWAREYRDHPASPVHFDNGLRWSDRRDDWVLLDMAERKREFQRLLDCSCAKAHVLAVNYEACSRAPLADWLTATEWDLAVADECHRIQAAGGKWSRHVHRVGKRSRFRLALTGTPMDSGPLSIFGQFRFVDESVFGLSYTSFKRKYVEWGGYKDYEIIRYINEEELSEKFHSRAYVIDASVLNLLPPRDVPRSCQLSAEARRIYRELDKKLYVGWGEGEVTAENILVKLLRLAQITSGHVNDDDGSTHHVDDSKERLLQEVLEDVQPRSVRYEGPRQIRDEEPVVVFCRFVPDLDAVRRVTEKLGRRYGELSGRRNDLDADAKMPEGIDVMAVQVQAGGVGIDLTRAAYGVFYSLSYSLTEYRQCRGRLVRPGQDRSVLFVHLICQGTKDEDVYAALEAKEDVVDYIIRQLREESQSD